MHEASLAIAVLTLSVFLTVLFQYWGYKKLRRTRRKQFPEFRHGGLQIQFSIVFAIAAIVAFVVLMAEIF